MQQTFQTTVIGMIALALTIALLHVLTGDLGLAMQMTGSATLFVLGSYLTGLVVRWLAGKQE